MKTISNRHRILAILFVTMILGSCHPTHFTVGKGPQQHQVTKSKNKFLLLGLVHVGTAPDANTMSNHASDYEITVKLTFVDVLLKVVTFGIYSPISVEVEN